MGSLLQRAGFSLPVTDSEEVNVSYRAPIRLLQDLRSMAETNVLVERRSESGLKSDDEPMMSMETIAEAALAMLTLPPDVNFLEAIVLPRDQAYLARG